MPTPTAGADASLERAVLGVGNSLLGRFWLSSLADERKALALAQRLSLSELTARVLSARGVNMDAIPAFLDPKLRDWMPDPMVLADMEQGAERIAAAVMQGETIGILGDYDVDGATSTALLLRFFDSAGARAVVHIPDRIKEGYGPNTEALLALKTNHRVSLVITVDCGTLSFGPFSDARNAGLDLVVVDHHTAEPRLPDAVAVINPNRLDDRSGLGQMAAVGVAYLTVIAVNRLLRDAGWYGERPEPDLLQWLDLVALGTVCDVVPLTGLNRAFVTQGLRVMGKRGNIGLTALADKAGVDEPPACHHLGFILGPRVNAGGRVGASDLGYRLLSTRYRDEAWHLAETLDRLNKERQDLERSVLDQAVERVKRGGGPSAAIVVAGEGWHPGVAGIVASRLKERYNRPACVIALDADGVRGTGSGRSVPGVDLGAAVIAARQAGLLTKGGGHPMAAGFSLSAKELPEFVAFLNERVGRIVAGRGLRATSIIDGALSPEAATLALAGELEKLGPFGSGNPEPRFVIPHARVSYADRAGGDHVRCVIAREGQRGGLKAIAFRVLETPLGGALLELSGRPIHLMGRLRVNTWQGRSDPQFHIEDAAWPS